jgi:hypothetical protein
MAPEIRVAGKRGAVEQGDEADEAEHNGASQLIPSVRRTDEEAMGLGVTEPSR